MPDPARQEKLPTQTVHCCLLQRHCEDLQQKVKHQTVPKKLLLIHQAALPPYPIFVTVPRPRQVMLLINIFAGLPVSPSVFSYLILFRKSPPCGASKSRAVIVTLRPRPRNYKPRRNQISSVKLYIGVYLPFFSIVLAK